MTQNWRFGAQSDPLLHFLDKLKGAGIAVCTPAAAAQGGAAAPALLRPLPEQTGGPPATCRQSCVIADKQESQTTLVTLKQEKHEKQHPPGNK